ncbi:uncharacterized protein EDB91DRAFT_1165055 [Suillus paluster]|uniref:uncharacterized protein n=1 Tax=Suillus paluster TaxID=48578 RepID=UPI001B87FD19|nr:uncharacterized protein EDB91DRAFT_1165055 [Suillus paluster]KAG1726948.1 hypothetical protein EDB91DRAFT_1165055 [Suillus paluster]
MDEEHRDILQKKLPRPAGATKGYSLLYSSVDTLLETKRKAADAGLRVPGLQDLLDNISSEAVTEGKRLERRKWWYRCRNMRDCKKQNETYQTSFAILAKVDEAASSHGAPVSRRRSFEELDTPSPAMATITPANIGPIVDNSKESTAASGSVDVSQHETVLHIAEVTAARTLELFLRHSGVPGGEIVNHFQGCIFGPSGTAPTVNFGGRNNRGAAVANPFLFPTEAGGIGLHEDCPIGDAMDVD